MAISTSIGTTFSWNGAVIAELTSINGIKLSAKFQDVTTHDVTDSYTKEIPSLITAGDMALEGFLEVTDTAGQLAMVTDFNAKTLRTSVITLPAITGASWTVDGYISEIEIGNAPIDGMIPFNASIKPYGKPVFAIATSAGLTTTFFAISGSAVVIPAASGIVYTYTASVLTAVASVTVTPIATAGVITVNGNVVATGAASSAITLGGAGSITTITIVVTETSKAPKTYTIYLARA